MIRQVADESRLLSTVTVQPTTSSSIVARPGLSEKLRGKQPQITQDTNNDNEIDSEYEVLEIVGVKWGQPEKKGRQIMYKIRWKGYNSSEDTWEYPNNLSCSDAIEAFWETKQGAAKKREFGRR